MRSFMVPMLTAMHFNYTPKHIRSTCIPVCLDSRPLKMPYSKFSAVRQISSVIQLPMMPKVLRSFLIAFEFPTQQISWKGVASDPERLR